MKQKDFLKLLSSCFLKHLDWRLKTECSNCVKSMTKRQSLALHKPRLSERYAQFLLPESSQRNSTFRLLSLFKKNWMRQQSITQRESNMFWWPMLNCLQTFQSMSQVKQMMKSIFSKVIWSNFNVRASSLMLLRTTVRTLWLISRSWLILILIMCSGILTHLNRLWFRK